MDEQLISASLLSVAISYEQDRLKIYYPVGNHIYSYDVNSHEVNLIREIDEMFFLTNLEIVSHRQLAFLSENLDCTEQKYFGVVNLESGEAQSQQLDFPVSKMIIQGSYLLLTENTPPAFWGGILRGEVIVFNFITGESYIIKLEGYESANAIVIDNRYILTGTHELIRLYDIQTNELILERQPSIEMIHIESTVSEEGIYPHIHTFLLVSPGLYAIVFDTGDGSFHVEFVMIER